MQHLGQVLERGHYNIERYMNIGIQTVSKAIWLCERETQRDRERDRERERQRERIMFTGVV